MCLNTPVGNIDMALMKHKIELFPKVSVITPSFNQGKYLREAPQSVVDQRYPELELIVIDGGSTDDSVAVIESFADSIHYWVSEKDDGQSHAINKGFEKATGDIICWLNSDDVFLPGALNAVAYFFEKNPDWRWLSAPSPKFGESQHVLDGIYEPPKKKLEWLLHCPISQPSTFWRRSLYDKHGGLDQEFHFALDYEYWIRFIFGEEELHFINRPLSAYRLHDVSKTVAQSEMFRGEEMRIREKYKDKMSPSEWDRLTRLLARTVDMDAFSDAVKLLEEGRRDEALKSTLSILKRNPALLLTRTGAASLYRVLANKRRYT